MPVVVVVVAPLLAGSQFADFRQLSFGWEALVLMVIAADFERSLFVFGSGRMDSFWAYCMHR